MSIARLYQIGKTFLNYGLDELLPQHLQPWYAKYLRKSLFWLPNKNQDKSEGARLRLALQTLGPVWIKFGQMLSTRRDLLPHDMAQELAQLQDNVAPFDGEQAQKLIEQALDLEHISALFEHFEQQPLASASIAQVHTAQLQTEQGLKDVVVKVIRPDIEKQILADLSLMEQFAKILAGLVSESRRLRPVEVVREYRKTLLDELDLMREGANAIQLRRNFEGSEALYIPEVYSDHSRQNVLVMERIYGIPVSDTQTLEAQGTDMKLLAERGVEVFFTQVFRDSFFHADMHPGNIFVSYEHPENPQYIGIDCGIVGTLNREDKRYLAENFIAFFNRDYRQVAQLHVDSGWVPADTCVEEFEFAIRTVCEPIFNKPLAEISFGHVLVNLFNTARRFNMEVQPQLVLLQKTLLYVEGLGRQLYPQLDLWQTAKPFLEHWVQEQVGPLAVAKKLYQNLPFWAEKMPELPDLIYQNLKRQHHRPPTSNTSVSKQTMQSILLGMAASTFAIIAGLCFIAELSGASLGSALFACLLFICAWRKTG
ncbi:ubiquinone biosynthesis regulatory protein kinase UbiB [Pseudoalteromonas luteoviolacea]|uniref:Probable protein kinase UbiB n=1 Tax=Pseudoalteromonas luteoviolacea S4054 TaxID=1129367 RepID=A0A0F6AHA3_9GAMM|nr:ubiquinone biosynthesis regulatory protein kinase UbiB [Pseudoalteromonas luteoviolacea]AOT06462.1 ubiquinone biosynthesis regulatory protein kinase UbiB [Pseudoalteromonas luteoviolacea]AOT11379.1 ubiquinone biosynthesis regulatory protein kinase UbiB [Pseudoalteromonas luteoviolacea]AOT16292.1 ubiquinone biosynthesis regulatory protein kinase UbiB [Pseudoalteromonas luteoviolacea]KKE85528.1 ubiquinone biosynthesis protein UbiB [Pseudoalteromonas luteoviolacea S4054]KZN73066.1 ubiquinone b